MPQIRKSETGVTLIELMIVIAIMAVIANFAIPNYLNMRSKALVTKCITAMESIQTSVNTYIGENDKVPGIADLISENLISSAKIEVSCLAIPTLINRGGENGIYTVTANPTGAFEGTCTLILTHTGLNTIPSLPSGCRR